MFEYPVKTFLESVNRKDLGQKDVDFFNGLTFYDVKLFMDPTLIYHSEDPFIQECKKTIESFFNMVLDAVRNEDDKILETILDTGSEINQTRLGSTKSGISQGTGSSSEKLQKIFKHMGSQDLIRKEVIKEFFEIPIYLKDFAEDRMSDLITNIILGELAKYSIDQCELIDSGKYITKEKVNLGKGWDREGQKWIDIESRVIRLNSKGILLIPKSMVRKNLFYSPEKYFRHIILDWRQDDHLEKETDLIRIHPKTNKKSPPTKKVIMEKEFKDKGLLKDICVRTTLDNPGVLEEYKKRYQAKLRYAKPLIDDELMQIVMKTKLDLEALV